MKLCFYPDIFSTNPISKEKIKTRSISPLEYYIEVNSIEEMEEIINKINGNDSIFCIELYINNKKIEGQIINTMVDRK
jgi:hypothetical protein